MPAPDDTAASWTPGPWRIRDEDGPPTTDVMVGERLLVTVYPDHYKHRDPERQGAEVISRSYAEAEANASLIAASPSLARALDSAPIISKYHGHQGFETERFIADYEAWRVIARAALALARGETKCLTR